MRDHAWMNNRERSNVFALTIIIWITRLLGRSIGHLALYPICLYFLLFSPRSVAASRQFLGKVMDSPVRLRDVFHHHYVFACTLLDRIHLSRGKVDAFTFELHGVEKLREQLAGGSGVIMLGSHLGSFEAMRALGVERALPVKLLMYQQHAAVFRHMMKRLDPELPQMIIDVGSPDCLLQVRDALSAGCLVGTLGDRPMHRDKTVTCRFLDQPATFPAGPFLMAGLLKAPIFLFFCLHTAKGRYDIYVEQLAAEVTLDGDRHAEVSRWSQVYADRLGHYARMAPYNWFNFYDFWQEQEPAN